MMPLTYLLGGDVDGTTYSSSVDRMQELEEGDGWWRIT